METAHYQERKVEDGEKENRGSEVWNHYIKRNPVLQDPDHGCGWQAGEFVRHYLRGIV